MGEPLDIEAIEKRLDFGHTDAWLLLEEVKRQRQELADLQAKHREVEAARDAALAQLREARAWADSCLASGEALLAADRVWRGRAEAAEAQLEKARACLDRPIAREHHALCDVMDFFPGAPAKPCNCGYAALRSVLGVAHGR